MLLFLVYLSLLGQWVCHKCLLRHGSEALWRHLHRAWIKHRLLLRLIHAWLHVGWVHRRWHGRIEHGLLWWEHTRLLYTGRVHRRSHLLLLHRVEAHRNHAWLLHTGWVHRRCRHSRLHVRRLVYWGRFTRLLFDHYRLLTLLVVAVAVLSTEEITPQAHDSDDNGPLDCCYLSVGAPYLWIPLIPVIVLTILASCTEL